MASAGRGLDHGGEPGSLADWRRRQRFNDGNEESRRKRKPSGEEGGEDNAGIF
jgi:hypothetical protein